MRLTLLKLLVGLVAGIAFWTVALPPLTTVVAAVVNPMIRVDRRFRQSDVSAGGETIHVNGTKPLEIRADQITYNLILLVALFAANRSPLSRANLVRFLLSLAITCAAYFVAVFVWIEAGYATVFGAWSETQYSRAEATVWVALQYLYQVVGMFAIVFLCWWISSADALPFRRSA